jgi:hypothetical protein
VSDSGVNRLDYFQKYFKKDPEILEVIPMHNEAAALSIIEHR